MVQDQPGKKLARPPSQQDKRDVVMHAHHPSDIGRGGRRILSGSQPQAKNVRP
jgi:hypothetical protein